MKKILLAAGLLVLFATEILPVYFIMPFPGSQKADGSGIGLAYFLHTNILFTRIFGLALIAIGLINSFSRWKKKQKIFFIILIAFYAFIFYLANFDFIAENIFYPLPDKAFAPVVSNNIKSYKPVIGVTINGESKAYPIEIIGYHHQVEDTIGGEPVIITYCTVCRTGRVYSLFINGKKNSFRLIGMDKSNAMFEDKLTKSWWQQATGVAITGPLKGQSLKEIPSQQMTLSAWLRTHPNSTVLQRDTTFQQEYQQIGGYDKGLYKGSMAQRNWNSWQSKSWVVGIQGNEEAKAYDWNELRVKQVINDSVGNFPVVIVLEPDRISYHVWSRQVNNQSLEFIVENSMLRDKPTNSIWNFDGICITGPMAGQRLKPVQASQEFWHSWQTFHPATLKYNSFRG